MKAIGIILICLTALPAYAARKMITCVNPATKAELRILGDSKERLANLVLNSSLANILDKQGIKNAYTYTGIGTVDWDTLSFSETSPYGESVYFRADREGRRLVFVSQQYKVIGDFLFNPGECKVLER